MANDPRPVNFAFVSCQSVNEGTLNGYRRMIFEDERAAPADQLGFVLHLGDFIYEVVEYPDEVPIRYDRTIYDVGRIPDGGKASKSRIDQSHPLHQLRQCDVLPARRAIAIADRRPGRADSQRQLRLLRHRRCAAPRRPVLHAGRSEIVHAGCDRERAIREARLPRQIATRPAIQVRLARSQGLLVHDRRRGEPDSGERDPRRNEAGCYRVYEHSEQISDLAAGIIVRTAVEPESIVPAVRQAIWSLDKNQPLAHIRALDSMIDRQLSTSSQSASLLGAFAMLALVLASLGIYGVLAYAVAQRTNEIGVRTALGATAGEILRSFTRHEMGLTVVGLVVGLAAAGAASRLLSTLLYGYRPDYVSTAAAVSIILLVVAAFACLVPARRASRTDPMIALRLE